MPVSESVKSIARTLRDAGYEAWCVGGAIRDFLLDVPDADADLATSAPPDVVRRLFKRTIPIGIEHGTVAVFGKDRQPHEVTTFRRDVRTDGRHAVVEFGVSLEEDLARRDFTINAIAYDPIDRKWCDRFDGEGDLSAGIIRAVGDPGRRFREDHLRILRAVRFASRFGFRIETATWEAACRAAPSLAHLSAERVREEWWKGIEAAKQVSGFVTRWRDVGALDIWMPEVPTFEPGWAEAMAAIDDLSRDAVLVIVRLSADPPATLRRLRCSNQQIDRAAAVSSFREDVPGDLGAVTVRRWLAAVGSAADDLLTLWEADGADRSLREVVEGVRREHLPLRLGDLALSGNELLALGVPEGPDVGLMLRRLLDRVLESPELNQPETLTAMARDLMEGRGG